MNLRTVDLNLLVVLEAVIDEAHVSRAAERLGLSQPATSSALERCRQLFGDTLLERTRGGMRLTPRAEALRQPLKDVLAAVRKLVQPDEVDLRSLRQTVRLVMIDHLAALLVPSLRERMATSAPLIDIVVQPWHGASAALDALGRGDADLAASVFPVIDDNFRRVELLQERYVVVMDRDHPAADGFDLDRWLAFPHLVVSGKGDTRSAIDDHLASLGRARRVGVVAPSFMLAPALLEGSDLICMLPSRCVPGNAVVRFRIFDPPVPVEGFTLHLAWHRRREYDPAVQHVAGHIQALLKEER